MGGREEERETFSLQLDKDMKKLGGEKYLFNSAVPQYFLKTVFEFLTNSTLCKLSQFFLCYRCVTCPSAWKRCWVDTNSPTIPTDRWQSANCATRSSPGTIISRCTWRTSTARPRAKRGGWTSGNILSFQSCRLMCEQAQKKEENLPDWLCFTEFCFGRDNMIKWRKTGVSSFLFHVYRVWCERSRRSLSVWSQQCLWPTTVVHIEFLSDKL